MKTFVTALIAAHFALLPWISAAESPPAPLPATSSELFALGDKSAREKRYVEALEAWKRGFERRFSGFRERAFLYPVEAAFLDRAGLRKKLLEELEKELPDEKAQAQQKAFAAFGFFGPELDLKATILELLGQEVAGFYDPDTKKLYLIREGKNPGERRWWEKLLEVGDGFDPTEQKTVLVHEMSHALMDQHHDLYSIHRSAEHDEDLMMAVSGLIEGEATLCMFVGGQGGSDKTFLTAPPGFMDPFMKFLGPLLAFSTGPAYRKAPRILKESLLFPYFRGMSFCLTLTNPTGTWSPVDEAFSAPPLSTEQILHPEKYPEDVPTELSFPDLAAELGSGWAPLYSNVLGEFQLRILLSERLPAARAEEAAEGWDGDFYRTYEDASRKSTLLAWASTWDSEEDAEEFAEALAEFVGKDRGDPVKEDSSWQWTRKGLAAAVIRRGADVWLLDGIPAERLAAISWKVLEVEKRPKTFRLRRAKPSVEFPEDRRIRAGRF